MASENLQGQDRASGDVHRTPAKGTATAILSMPLVRYPAAVAAVLVTVDCLTAILDNRWLSLAVNAPVVVFLSALASGALSRLADSGRLEEPHEAQPAGEPKPAAPPVSTEVGTIQVRKIERDKALYAVGAILRRRAERSGSSHEIWTTEIGEFEAYLTERFGQLGKAPPPDLHARTLMADRDAASHGDYREALAQNFARILEG